MFSFTKEKIETSQLQKRINDPHIGAIATFEGRVRNHNEGKPVHALDYEAYETLAVFEAKKIIEEVKQRFEIIDCTCVHGIGHLEVGDVAVSIVVAASHRKSAFDACRYLIDQIKVRLPIWKKEHYTDGQAEWVSCQGCSGHARIDISESTYYSRQTNLPNLGLKEQKKLKDSRVLVVGAGGLGCPALMYLAGAGIGHLGICDSDDLEVSNLHRQLLYHHQDIGKPKVDLAKQRLRELNPFSTFTPHKNRIDSQNVEKIIADYHVVLDCTDHLPTKFLLHDACRMHNIPFVQAGIYQFEGQLQTFLHKKSSSCLRCLWSEIPPEICIDSCSDVGVLGAVPGVLGALQAMEAIKVLLGWEGILESEMLLMNLLSNQISKIKRQKNPKCPGCGISSSITTIKPFFENTSIQQGWEIDLKRKLPQVLHDFEWIDIRDSEERNPDLPWEKALKHIPAKEISRFHSLKAETNYLLICERGIRSINLVSALRDDGLNQFYSLAGGIQSLKLHWNEIEKELKALK